MSYDHGVAAPAVVILAAGQGTRMRSALPKMLHPVCGQPLVQWPIAAAREAGADRIILVDSPERRLQALAGEGIEIAVQEQPLGTADAVKAGVAGIEPSREQTVVVLNGDVPLITARTIHTLVAEHERTGAAATIATMTLDDPSGYGRIIRAPDGSVERVAETKAAGDANESELHIREINTGMFAFDAAALAAALKQVKPDNAQGELYLPDVLPIMRAHERSVLAFEVTDHREILQINDRRQLADVTAVAQRMIHERHMLAGVTILNPAATAIDVGVAIGRDTVIAPFTSLHGATAIGAGSTVGPGATLIDAAVGDGSTILHAYITGATVGDRVNVGPFAYLRPGTVLREGSKAGTFVEIKNSDVGAGSKVPHLSYIGDADIGAGTNLGASTITANYDGYRKHRTTIGDGVKTSVDTTFIAPVSIGDGAYTAAGSVIDEDVPPGALGIARARQRNIEGYDERRRERESSQNAEPKR
ncbi:MAG: bifunctional UDP-N-acetylglucosamine pyrophosphorylase / glucosamine-phosphate N-acetyltransferase [Solirubrobacteraceae bacterium]|jgi:bifunctional UDP-N-acetylglucosamine pyrophosphorylase/glucosamine-1-phosphate N-acetyltransferase|nr:bifunctional UDP-N-acetylglucosamine pyrophosphorylase / glucosamine-phosphate N-acetyltransferase [Solirubrobacteraceae bacterium]